MREPLSAGTVSHLRRWYAVSLQPGREERAEWHLRQQGFEPFLPRHRRTVRHSRRLIVKRAAFFPGYMFVHLDLARERWRAINGTVGVRSLVMQGERPVPCPIGLVEQFLDVTDETGLMDIRSGFEAGRSVRIVSGPLTELVGTLERLDGPGRARVLLKIMNGEIAVAIDVKDLAAA
jgi:transcriptional antiterminator RfaH